MAMRRSFLIASLLFVPMALGPSLAHLLELPNKLALDRELSHRPADLPGCLPTSRCACGAVRISFPRCSRSSRFRPIQAPTAELTARVESWVFWTWFREPLDALALTCALLAFRLDRRRLTSAVET